MGGAAAAWLAIAAVVSSAAGDPVEASAGCGFLVEARDAGRMCFVVSYTNTRWSLQPEGTGFVVRLEGALSAGIPGAPDVPVMGYVLAVPRNVAPALRISRDESCRTQDVVVAAFPTRQHRYAGARRESTATRNPDPSIYGAGGLWPPDRWSVSEAWMGTNRLLRIAFHPVQFDPRTPALVICTNFLGEISLQDLARPTR